MLLIVGKDGVERKYSCMTCIKGHRSSKCKHPQRQLHEIKPKGRPVSQCQNCRELRKQKRVHIKCSCKNRGEGSASPTVPMVTTPGGPSSAATDNTQIESDKQNNTPNEFMHEHGDMLLKRCPRCERSQSACICTYNSNMRKAQEHDNISSGSSDGTQTPTSSTSSVNTSPSSPYNVLPPLRLNHSHQHLPIPIHDPTDDINSDTPLYKPDLAPDREAVLGHLSHRSSEDLMKEIYSKFMGPPKKRRRRRENSPGESHTQPNDYHDDENGRFEQELDTL